MANLFDKNVLKLHSSAKKKKKKKKNWAKEKVLQMVGSEGIKFCLDVYHKDFMSQNEKLLCNNMLLWFLLWS